VPEAIALKIYQLFASEENIPDAMNFEVRIVQLPIKRQMNRHSS